MIMIKDVLLCIITFQQSCFLFIYLGQGNDFIEDGVLCSPSSIISFCHNCHSSLPLHMIYSGQEYDYFVHIVPSSSIVLLDRD